LLKKFIPKSGKIKTPEEKPVFALVIKEKLLKPSKELEQ